MKMLNPLRPFNRLLAHRDRWRGEKMLIESSADVQQPDSERDFRLFQQLFFADEPICIDDYWSTVREATWGEYVQVDASKYVVLPADQLLRGATYKESMTRREACEAVIGRLHKRYDTALVIDDGEEGLEIWIEWDPVLTHLPGHLVRCPGGINRLTGRAHRIVWACFIVKVPWSEDSAPLTSLDELKIVTGDFS